MAAGRNRLDSAKVPVFSLLNREIAAQAPKTGSPKTACTATPLRAGALRRICHRLGCEAGCPSKLQRRRASAMHYVYLIESTQTSRFLRSAVPPSRATGAISWSGKAKHEPRRPAFMTEGSCNRVHGVTNWTGSMGNSSRYRRGGLADVVDGDLGCGRTDEVRAGGRGRRATSATPNAPHHALAPASWAVRPRLTG